MLHSPGKHVSGESWPSDIGSVLQRMAVVFLGLMAFACIHAILYHLHYILAPFVLSGFLVFAVEPTVDRIYKSLAGLASPHRWCCCCMHRRWRRSQRRPSSVPAKGETSEEEDSMGAEERQESLVLLPEPGEPDWEGFAVQVLDALCRFAAVLVVIGALFFMIALLLYLLASGALHIKDNWKAYKIGVDRWIATLDRLRDILVARLNLSGNLDYRVRMLYTNVLTKFQEGILELVNMIVSFITGSVSFSIIVILYMIFWLYQPLPIGGKAGALVHSYIWKKTVVSVLYGMSVSTLLFCLGIDLPAFFGLVSFFLNYVPEVGAFISMFAPVPIILLDGEIERPVTYLIVALLGQVILKLLIGNLLELRLVQNDHEMSIHPVWVLLSLNYLGFLWGPVGMLISVPLLATLKSIVISKEDELKDTQPFLADAAGHFLACLEGRRKSDERRRSSWLLPLGASLPLSCEKGLDSKVPQEQPAAEPTSGEHGDGQADVGAEVLSSDASSQNLEHGAENAEEVPPKSSRVMQSSNSQGDAAALPPPAEPPPVELVRQASLASLTSEFQAQPLKKPRQP